MVEITGLLTANWTGCSACAEGYGTPPIQPDLALSDTHNKQTIHTHTHTHTHTHEGRTQSSDRSIGISRYKLKTVFSNSFTRCKRCLIVEDNFQHLLKHAVKQYCTLQADNVDSISAFRLQLDVLHTEHTKAPD
jgi:hypothetical protein